MELEGCMISGQECQPERSHYGDTLSRERNNSGGRAQSNTSPQNDMKLQNHIRCFRGGSVFHFCCRKACCLLSYAPPYLPNPNPAVTLALTLPCALGLALASGDNAPRREVMRRKSMFANLWASLYKIYYKDNSGSLDKSEVFQVHRSML